MKVMIMSFTVIALSSLCQQTRGFSSRYGVRMATLSRQRVGASLWMSSSSSSSGSSSNSKSGGGRVSNAVTDANLLEKTTKSDGNNNNKKKQQQKKKLDTNPAKGTRDFNPNDMKLQSWLFGQWREVASAFGFSEYDAPVLESEALYTRKAGEEVTEQLYCFEDKGGRRVALRPEMTPSLARIVMKDHPLMPIKWFSIPQCWRYERMTRGRRREHYQWNMDIWGVSGVQAEAELLRAMVTFFTNIGLTSDDVGIKLNSRLIISELSTKLDIPADKFAQTCVLIDKLEKVPLDAIQSDLEELGLKREVVEKLVAVLSGDNTLQNMETVLTEDSEAIQQLKELMELCKAYDIQDWIQLDFSVVRGLAYYTGAVFEAFDRTGTLRAIAGGGRYDSLLETFGGDSTPAVGFGFGDAVIVELLKERNLLPSLDEINTVDSVVYAMKPELYSTAIQVAQTLRQAGQSVDVILEPNKKTKWVFKYAADRIKANYCVIIAPQEYENNQVSIKDLKQKEQTTVNLGSDLLAWAQQTKTQTS
uniref:histidine--tRNA ligase n=1 Tax=Eucampia antarctica TaxID=49252 RepID=A0A7S2S5G9_9STRA